MEKIINDERRTYSIEGTEIADDFYADIYMKDGSIMKCCDVGVSENVYEDRAFLRKYLSVSPGCGMGDLYLDLNNIAKIEVVEP